MNDRFEVRGILPENSLPEIPAGHNIGIIGPTMTGKQRIAIQMLATPYNSGEGILCITTNRPEEIYDVLRDHVDSLDRERVGIIDASGREGRELVDVSTETVSSPSDLTGISIGTAKLSRQLESQGVRGVRYGLISVSTLLQYLDSQTVFQFLHVFTKRIEETEGLGIFILDSDSHNPQVVNTITGQFDGIVQLRESENNDLEFRIRGFDQKTVPWQTLEQD